MRLWSVECVASELDWSADLVEKHIRDRSPAMVVAVHAEALVALLNACEENDDVLRSFVTRNGPAYATTANAIQQVLDAVACVHAVKESP